MGIMCPSLLAAAPRACGHPTQVQWCCSQRSVMRQSFQLQHMCAGNLYEQTLSGDRRISGDVQACSKFELCCEALLLDDPINSVPFKILGHPRDMVGCRTTGLPQR